MGVRTGELSTNHPVEASEEAPYDRNHSRHGIISSVRCSKRKNLRFRGREFHSISAFALCLVERLIRRANQGRQCRLRKAAAGRRAETHGENPVIALRVLDLQRFDCSTQLFADFERALAVGCRQDTGELLPAVASDEVAGPR